MAVVDADCNFIYCDMGANGRISDGGVFAACSVSEWAVSPPDLSAPYDYSVYMPPDWYMKCPIKMSSNDDVSHFAEFDSDDDDDSIRDLDYNPDSSMFSDSADSDDEIDMVSSVNSNTANKQPLINVHLQLQGSIQVGVDNTESERVSI